jgi:hypothetical protein
LYIFKFAFFNYLLNKKMLIVEGTYTNDSATFIFQINYSPNKEINLQIFGYEPGGKTASFLLNRSQLRNFLNDVLNKEEKLDPGNGRRPFSGKFKGRVLGFLPPESEDKAGIAESALIFTGQQMARANRGELQVSPEIMQNFGLQSQTEIPRSIIPLLQTSRQFSAEEPLWDALKDEPLNKKTKNWQICTPYIHKIWVHLGNEF